MSGSSRVHLTALLLPMLLAGGAQAAEEFSDPDKWRIKLTPLLWVAGVDGEAETRFGTGGSTSSSFDDVVANLDFGFMMHAEVAKGKWAILFDGIYIDIGTEGSGPFGGDVEGDVRLAMADVGVAYQFFEVPLSNSEKTPRLLIDGIVGARYIGLKVELDPEVGRSRSRSTDLIDPYVGARLTLPLNDQFTLGFKGTVGGFGVGSELDWTIGIFADYRVATWCSFLLGYHVMGLEIEDGGRFDGLDFDATFHGPIIGVTFHL